MSRHSAERAVVALLVLVGTVQAGAAAFALQTPPGGPAVLALRVVAGLGGLVVVAVAALVRAGRVGGEPLVAVAAGAVAVSGAAFSVDAAHPAWLQYGMLASLVALYAGLVALTVGVASDTP
ncbi:MAG: hypothetical protein ABEJ68_10000 [Halobacteriaceae archaeon]